MKIVAISDTHGMHHRLDLPDGDMLIFAGDYTARHSAAEFDDFINWFQGRPHQFKIFVPGNHDRFIEFNLYSVRAKLKQLDICCPSSKLATLGGLRIYSMPLMPMFCDWAFMVPDGSPKMIRACDRIPEGLDILVTHGPARGILDTTDRGDQAGSASLRDAIALKKPRLHICGHIHEAYGRLDAGYTIHVNASVVDSRYRLRNKPVVVDLP